VKVLHIVGNNIATTCGKIQFHHHVVIGVAEFTVFEPLAFRYAGKRCELSVRSCLLPQARTLHGREPLARPRRDGGLPANVLHNRATRVG
jgi:hypothetical protein